MRPAISVIVPTYNRADMIGGCIETILSQTMKDFELIIVSDGSTDKTEEIVRSYREPGIHFLKKDNGGQASARNLGLINARGEYVALCDDDDRFYPDHLATLNAFLKKNLEVGLTYSDARWNYLDSSRKPEIRYSQDFDKKTLENFNYISPVNVLFKKSCLQKSGLFNENQSYKGLEDWDFFLRLSDHYPCQHIKEVTSEYNVHGKNSFHPASGYDYNLAFFLVRNQRFQYLHEKFGALLFDHVDHMYPMFFVQCYLDNGKMTEGLEMAAKLQDLYKFYARKSRPASSHTELVILFSLGISCFLADDKNEATLYFNRILEHSGFNGIEKQFRVFVGQYVNRTPDADLKILLMDYFSLGR